MLYTVKRLALGLSLIALTSAILLFADRGRRATAGPRVQRVVILQHANTVVLDEGIRGVLDALAERGYRDGEEMAVTRLNAQGDMPTGIAMAQQAVSGGYDLAITSSTPSMQALANSNREGKVRHVFTLVADPWASGVGLDRANPLGHPPYMAGHGSFPPVERAFQLAHTMLPALQRIGVAWNPAETNSRLFVEKGREAAKAMNLTLLEANVDSTSAVTDAINSLLSRNAQAIWIGGDNTVIAGVGSVIAIATRMRIPVFTVLPGAPDRGTIFDAGPDFYAVGRESGFMAADVLDGADIATMPIRDVLDVLPPYLSVNTNALKNLKEPWRAGPEVLSQATVVVDETGTHRKTANAASASSSPRPATKQWRISLIELNKVVDVEEAEKGVLDGLRETGLVEGRDYVKTIRDAQGDMATVSGLIDAALSEGADMLITFSTPTLQAAVQRAKQIPVIFNYVADPIAAGAGTSNTSHAPNVTGVYLIGAYDQMLPVLRAYVPRVRTVGTVNVPAEVNMVSQLDAMTRVMRPAGIEVKSIAANATGEVGEAALALVSANVDAIVQIPGNLTAAAFPSIAEVTRRARVPVFGFMTSQVRGGAVAAVARDYYDSGREAAKLAARVMRGEAPTGIPFVGFGETKLIVNLAAAKAIGLASPGAIVAKADEVIGR